MDTNLKSQSGTGKKILLALGLIAVSAIYGIWTSVGTSGAQLAATPPAPTPSAQNDGTSGQSSPPPPRGNPGNSGLYADGTYIGSAADAFYGIVQVQATVANGKLTGVQFLKYPNDNGTSRFISSMAIPQLTSEAIAAQSANVDVVSGASQTSEAFIQSLGSALAKAKA